jgi:hypothetical protein
LPRIYPMDHVVESFVYYGKWKSGFPHEIRVDVFNPTITGNYYFMPLIWNAEVGNYKMKSDEPIYGKRPKWGTVNGALSGARSKEFLCL